VTAHDFIEHIPKVICNPQRRNSFIELMNETWRVLKVGGRFLSVTPAFPQPAAFVDPTHVNIITEQIFPLYFDDKIVRRRVTALLELLALFHRSGRARIWLQY
jgi:hypothetical protein